MSSTFVSLSSLDGEYLDKVSHANSEPQWMSEIREAAFSKYKILPSEVSPLYTKYSDANRLEPEQVKIPRSGTNYQPNHDIVERIKELDKEKEKETSILRIGSQTFRSHITETMSKQGIVVMDLREALKTHGEIIKSYLTKNTLNYGEDKF